MILCQVFRTALFVKCLEKLERVEAVEKVEEIEKLRLDVGRSASRSAIHGNAARITLNA